MESVFSGILKSISDTWGGTSWREPHCHTLWIFILLIFFILWYTYLSLQYVIMCPISFWMVSNVWEEQAWVGDGMNCVLFIGRGIRFRFPFLSSQIIYGLQFMSSLILVLSPVFVSKSTRFSLFHNYFPNSVSLGFGSWSFARSTDIRIVNNLSILFFLFS